MHKMIFFVFIIACVSAKLCQDDWRNNTYTGEISQTSNGIQCLKWSELKTKLLKETLKIETDLILEHLGLELHAISFRFLLSQARFLYLSVPKTGRVLFLEHSDFTAHQI